MIQTQKNVPDVAECSSPPLVGAYRRKSQHFKTSLPVIAVWLSVYSKIHESSKSEVKPQIKVVIMQQ